MDDFAPHASHIKNKKRLSFTIFVSGRLQTGHTTNSLTYLSISRSKVSLPNFPWKIALVLCMVAAVAISPERNFSIWRGSRLRASQTSLKLARIVRIPVTKLRGFGISNRLCSGTSEGSCNRARFSNSL